MRCLLVANRGEIALRVMRTAREMGISTVAVYSDADSDAPHVAAADTAVRLPGLTPAETYLRGDLVVAAARRAGADAVHPGYGFLSENASFAQAVLDAGLVWVGPPPAAIAAMGSKLAAKEAMRAAGVPTLPWTVEPSRADKVGYPLLVKASAGGGGRGMRIVRAADELDEAVASARREAGSAFGDDTVFLERFVEAPRHIEIQVFADVHGNVVSLFERECSIQRRHQKIVEEAPSPAVDDDLRRAMGAAAVTAARTVGYVGAGTVEFVYDEATRTFAFLEMNTRLQVEHPVTEAVTGLDLVRLQLMVADGHPLPPEALSPVLHRHAIEVRLYAEDPHRDFLPATGTLRSFHIGGGVRVDAGVTAGSVISPYYDPMLAKVVVLAPTRSEAAARLAAALASARISGVTTNRDLLVGILREPEFLAGATDTAYLDRHPPAALAGPDPAAEVLHATAAALALQATHRSADGHWGRLPSGWRNNASQRQSVRLRAGDREVRVDYARSRDGWAASVDDVPVDLVVHHAGAQQVDLGIGGLRRRCDVLVTGTTIDVTSPLGSASFELVPRFPDPSARLAVGSLTAPMPGAVVRVLVAPDDVVAGGDPLVVLEAMKMEHTVAAPGPGVVREVPVRAGQQVDAGAVLAILDAAPSAERGGASTG